MPRSTSANGIYGAAAELGLKLAVVLILSPLFAAYGVFVIIEAIWRMDKLFSAIQRLSGKTVECHHCAHPNPLADRWRCGKCRAEYHGFVGSCPHCASTARAFSCARCRITIPLELE